MNREFLCRRDPAARLLVRGEDARTFLQGQFTNDLNRPVARPCTYGLWLNQKGRVLADSHAVQHGPNEFELISLTSFADVIRDRLEAYIIADDVAVEDATAGAAGWVVSAAILRDLGGEPPGAGTFTEAAGGIAFRARVASGPHWYICTPAEGAETMAARLADAAQRTGARTVAWNLLQRDRVTAGLPEIPAELGPGDLPNEGGLEHEAISFTKGCYLGQEVMARLHNLGQVRRRLFVVEALAPAGTLPRGTLLFAGEKRVGELRSLLADETPALGLAMLHTDHVAVDGELGSAPGGAGAVRVLRLAEGRAW